MRRPQQETGPGRPPRRGEGRRVAARAFTALLVLFASLMGVAQRAVTLGCAGSATAGVAGRPAAASPAVTSGSMDALPALTGHGAADPGAPGGTPGDLAHPVVACSGPVALPTVRGVDRGAPVASLRPTDRGTVLSGADAPKPPIGPPRLS